MSSTVGARIERRGGRVLAGGVPLPAEGWAWGGGPCPSPEKLSIFELEKGEFWCILGATFAVELNENWLGY